MRYYTKEVRPVVDVRDNVTITVGISLYLIRSMDDKDQMLTTSLWIRQIWYDPRLAWIPSNYSSVKSINIPAKKVWIPDIKVYNEVNVGRHSGLDQFQTRVVVDHDGKVKWMGPIVLRTSCSVDIQMFPFDTQTCKMKIGSWTYDGFALDVKPESYTMDISKSPSNLEWELVSTSVERNVQTYSCCPEPYPDVTYTITIKRRQQSYVVNFLFPALFLTAVTLMAFVTPGERIGLVLTCLVSMFFFLKMVAERTPSSDTVPLLSIYFVMLSFQITLTLYAVCISLNTYHKQPALSGMSRCVRMLVMERLGRIWGLTSINEEIKQKLESLQAIAEMTKSTYYKDFESDQTRTCDGQGRTTKSRVSIGETGFGINEAESQNHEIRSLDCTSDSCPGSSDTNNKQHESSDIETHAEGIRFGLNELSSEKHEIRSLDCMSNSCSGGSPNMDYKQHETNDINAHVKGTSHELGGEKHEIRSLDCMSNSCSGGSPNMNYKQHETSDINAHVEGTSHGLDSEKHEIRAINGTPSVRKQRGKRLKTSYIESSANIEDASYVERERDDHFINSKSSDQPGQNSYKQVQNFQKQPIHFCECELCETRTERTRCASFLNEMIIFNQRLISGIQEINLLARNWNYESSEKKHWVIAASILDKVFFVLFITMFVVLSLCNFLW